ncbi:MAG: bifunctional [glutamate--ammonia ligase]-adenylyl-L-tyrosine phosphorylase/[glutamate--ammonia-ligase] adenylyltransferase [Betaproteobacteria bacterium]|nr:bifunctional [glutamate--ammonia ligase]-adenylyl-L-tyrosine phosphorylase/[glutamate--ammonia-ligase] adenylyltransferase [Betaproteobacteria bacterium]
MESHNPDARDALSADALLARATRLSRYARHLVEGAPGFLPLDARVAHPFSADEMRALLAADPGHDEDALKRALRLLRKRVMLRLIARDLGGLAPLGEVLATTTTLAEVTVSHALARLDEWLAARHGSPVGAASGAGQQLHVLGMGKLGGAELNVSSDVDLVFAYSEEGETRGPRPISNHEYFTLLGRRLIGALSEITADGYVFRVDMRLRPYGDGGPLVASFDALEIYFITQGREWERYAWIKARAITGNREAELMELVRPFVYRRHLDYAAIAALRDLHGQIRHEVERRDLFDNIKLGPGGIREIEFIAQVFQLIRGGHDPELRKRPTLDVLPLLAQRNLLPAAAARELMETYRFLRNLEHRLQYLDDRQTHALPQPEADRALIAEAMGFGGYDRLAAALEAHRAGVTRHFEEIFAPSPAGEHALAPLWQENPDSEKSVAALAALGYRRPGEIEGRLRSMRSGVRYREMPAASQARLDQLVPLAIEAAAAGRDPDATLVRMLALLDSVSRRGSYLALLLEYPQALSRLAAMMGASPWVAQYLTSRPILLDELLDARTLYAAPQWPAAARQLRAQVDEAAGDTEKRMDVLRHFKHAQTMRLIAQDLSGALPLETLSDHLSDLACVVLEEVLRVAWPARQARRETPRFAVIAYGKLGGKELGYASDLDLVFLYDEPAPEAAENYARFAQRINNWLTSVTSAGVLYQTDLRLRPDGAGGLLVSPLESFREYQSKHAWPWEHQALTRARFVAGDRDIGAAFERLRVEILRRKRDLATLRRDIVAMRQKLRDGHPNRTPLFDLKHDRGGLIDVEFVVQYLVLGHAHAHEALTGNIGNLALLKLAARLGLTSEDRAQAAHDAYRRFRRLQHGLRLQGEPYARVDPAAVTDSRRAVVELWDTVMSDA